MMSLRALGSLITRRFSPRHRKPSSQAAMGIGIQKVPGSAARRPGSPLHTLSDLAVGDGVYRAVGAAAFAGLAVFLYFNKDTEKSAGKEAEKEVPDREVVKKEYLSREAAIKAGFVGKDGKVNWPEYHDYVNSQTYHGGMPMYNKEVAVKEANDREAQKLKDVKIDEEAMKARFHDWMKQYGRSYKNDEKSRRYEQFKKTAMNCDRVNASNPKRTRLAAPNGLADWTKEELERLDLHQGDFDWEKYVGHINSVAARGWYVSHEEFTVSEAVKQRTRELVAARHAEGRHQADNSRQKRGDGQQFEWLEIPGA